MNESKITIDNFKEHTAYLRGFYDGQLLEIKRQLRHEKNPEEAISWARKTLFSLVKKSKVSSIN